MERWTTHNKNTNIHGVNFNLTSTLGWKAETLNKPGTSISVQQRETLPRPKRDTFSGLLLQCRADDRCVCHMVNRTILSPWFVAVSQWIRSEDIPVAEVTYTHKVTGLIRKGRHKQTTASLNIISFRFRMNKRKTSTWQSGKESYANTGSIIYISSKWVTSELREESYMDRDHPI